jgi:hypothetical protein
VLGRARLGAGHLTCDVDWVEDADDLGENGRAKIMPTPTKKKEAKSQYRDLRTILLAELDRVQASEDCDIHRAFVHETARVFSSTASGFSLTDGPDDMGIDFCRKDSPVFTLAQCKCPERVSLESSENPKKYDRDALEDLLTGINFVLDAKNTYLRAPLDLKQFRSAYHESLREWKKETRLQAALSIFGELTGGAKNYFQNQRNTLESKGIELLLWDWHKFNDLLTTPHINIQNMKLTFTIDDPEKELLKRQSPVCLVRGIDLVNAWNQYQWNLVDWNVRAEIRNSPTNKRIQDTLLTPSGRRHFQDYNNGLLVVCKQVSYRDLPKNRLSITLRQPQVVNGCQTLLSLVRAYLDLPPRDKDSFTDDVRVQLKVIPNQSPGYVEKIIQSTNDQNPMSPRSLKSNTIEQKKLQESFQRYSVPYFYERKDGQFEGFLDFGQKMPSFRPRDYQIAPGKKRYRKLDNEKLAKEWIAFIGCSHETLRGGLRLFDDDDLYRRAFLVCPKKEFWQAIIEAPGNSPPVEADELFEEGSPSVSQYLLTDTVANVVRQRRVSFQKNRAGAIERLSRKGLIKVDKAGKPVDDAVTVESMLNRDAQYFMGIVINNMQDVILELYSTILCLKYGALDASRSEAILKYPPLRVHVENPYAEVPSHARQAESRHVLNLIYEFILFSVEQYVVKYGEAMRAQPRLKSYLAQRNTVNAFRSFLIEVNDNKVPILVEAWCPARSSFIDQLPKID